VAYFVPEKYRSFSAQMEDFLSALGGSLLRFPVPKGTESGNRSVRESVESGLRALSDELQAAVDSWSESTRTGTMDHAIERWQIIKHKAEAYSEYLGDRQASLLAKLAEQRRRLAQKIDEITALKGSPKTSAPSVQPPTLFPDPEPEPQPAPVVDDDREYDPTDEIDAEMAEEECPMPW